MNNLIIFGVERGDDDALVKDIFEVIQADVVKEDFKITRFKDKENANGEDMPGPILVEFKELEKKVKVLKVARNLKGTKYGKVFINQDLTEAEMARDKELRKRRAE